MAATTTTTDPAAAELRRLRRQRDGLVALVRELFACGILSAEPGNAEGWQKRLAKLSTDPT